MAYYRVTILNAIFEGRIALHSSNLGLTLIGVDSRSDRDIPILENVEFNIPGLVAHDST